MDVSNNGEPIFIGFRTAIIAVNGWFYSPAYFR